MKKIRPIEITVCDVCGESQSLDEPEPMAKCKCGRDVCGACAMSIRITPSDHQRCDVAHPNAVALWCEAFLCPDCGKRITEMLDTFVGGSNIVEVEA